MIPYARPSITEAEIDEVEATLRSGWLSTGPRADLFESVLARRLDVAHALGASSGTAALHLAVLAAGVRPGDEVITTPMTWVSTANVILHAGAKPVFVDVEPGTLNLDASRVPQALSNKTRAILPVHFAGQPCDEDALLEIARAHGLMLIEDAAHALGASYKGRPIGGIADVTMFSFHPAKNITTGEGGALTTNVEAIAARAKILRFHGIVQASDARFGGRSPTAYDTVEAGFKYNFTDIQAALGLRQLERLDEMNARRAQLAELYIDQLASVRHVEPLARAPYAHEHAWHILVVLLDDAALSVDRDAFIRVLRDKGVGAGLHFVPLHLQSLYRPMVSRPETLPVATAADRRVLTLPLFPDMTDADVGFVVDALAATIRRFAR